MGQPGLRLVLRGERGSLDNGAKRRKEHKVPRPCEAERLLHPLLGPTPLAAEEMDKGQEEQQITARVGGGNLLRQGQGLGLALAGLIRIAQLL